MFNTISMIGLGYIGLPTATLFASRRKKVIGVDVNQHAVDTINQGKIHIVEPDLDMLVQAAVASGYLRATTVPEPADAFLIAVPTPFTDGHKPDLSCVRAAAQAIAPVLRKDNLVILESTSPVGTTEKLARWLAEARPDLTFPQQAGEAADVQIAYCPERVLPGRVVHELVDNDRVIGGMTRAATFMAATLYKIFVRGDLIATNVRTAEMCKLAENSFRDVNIAFANELSMICDRLDIDVHELIRLANRHPRVNILQPGAGVGGHCIAVDPWFIVDQTPEEARLIRTAREVNDRKIAWVLEKVGQVAAAGPGSVKIACLGLAYKADVDDLRESPALSIVQALADSFPGCLAVVEPHIDILPESLREKGVAKMELKESLEWATVVVTLVGHRQFKSICFDHYDDTCIVDVAGIRKNQA
ncbi:UDP-N-acetyl-D-mannosaminuronic acid dehydrogenase [Desulfomicrobium macestii]|uniref:UDP-N-acetyl-D-mannosaminuronic acid dehydrogenase n=1 Tax=Desulfomicrobium macestii TaxID=90731 RepID=A0ABR9H998_9BACT|nr:UDP-N-acetyl-D-mannosamine dehydrogenase [Desulfomicrobium macestii]MBE1427294.1 UDP-N-acetyl-D-mannosaminuronic acid dehydrogenase [Desulfomicrobium macestii]